MGKQPIGKKRATAGVNAAPKKRRRKNQADKEIISFKDRTIDATPLNQDEPRDVDVEAQKPGDVAEDPDLEEKMAENNGGYKAVNFGYTDDRVYSKLTSDNPIDLVRYQLANCYMGRAGLINSGGAAGGETDLADAVRTAVINKRAGGMGLILGRKAFKKSMADGVKLINAVQDVYLDGKVTIA